MYSNPGAPITLGPRQMPCLPILKYGLGQVNATDQIEGFKMSQQKTDLEISWMHGSKISQ